MSKLNSETKIVDKFKLIHWLNIRKTTIHVLNELLSNKINKKLSLEDFENLDMYTASEIANTLSIPVHPGIITYVSGMLVLSIMCFIAV